MKKILIFLLIPIFLFGYYHYYYKQTPKYSLYQAYNAYEDHDITTFRKYVDIEGLSSNIVDDLIKHSIETAEKSTDEWEEMGQKSAEGLVELLKPTLIDLISKQISELVETGNIEEREKGEGISNLWRNTVEDKIKFEGVKYIKKDGKLAFLGLNYYKQEKNSEINIELKMRRIENYWQVATINNLNQLLVKLEKHRIKKVNKQQKSY